MKLPNSMYSQVNVRIVEIEQTLDYCLNDMFSSSYENERTTLKMNRFIIRTLSGM